MICAAVLRWPPDQTMRQKRADLIDMWHRAGLRRAWEEATGGNH